MGLFQWVWVECTSSVGWEYGRNSHTKDEYDFITVGCDIQNTFDMENIDSSFNCCSIEHLGFPRERHNSYQSHIDKYAVILICIFYSRIQSASQSPKRPVFPQFWRSWWLVTLIMGFTFHMLNWTGAKGDRVNVKTEIVRLPAKPVFWGLRTTKA